MTNSLSHQQYLDVRHFAGLDGLRAVAIIAVIWHHSAKPIPMPMLGRGYIGVDLFFVLSGFLIVTLLIRERAKTGKISLTDFWMRRVLRLVPAYYLLLFSLLAAYTIFKPGDAQTEILQNGFWVYALYLSNWFQPGADNLSLTWSLATEEQFYLVWPLFEALTRPFITAGFWVIAVIVNQLINFGVLDSAMQSAFGINPDHFEILGATFTPILFGVGLAHALHRARGFAMIQKLGGFKYAPAIFAGAIILVLNIPAADIGGAIRLSLHILMTLWLASVVIQPTSRTTRALEWRPLGFIGAISYGMYLYHMWAIHVARAVIGKLNLPQEFLQFGAGLAGTVIVAAASYYLFEKRFLNLRSKFRH